MPFQENRHSSRPAPRPAGRVICALVLDDNRETRNWITETLSSTIAGAEITAAATCAEARRHLFGPESVGFDFALVDLDLPDGNGIEIIRAIAQTLPQTIPIVLTIFDDDAWLFDALAAGAMGYILKGVKTASLADQFRRIAQGEPPISPSIALRMIDHFRNHAAAPPRPPVPDARDTTLTAREQEVLRLLAKGLTTADIAVALGISANTSATHTKAIYRKLNISSRAEAALAAGRYGLI